MNGGDQIDENSCQRGEEDNARDLTFAVVKNNPDGKDVRGEKDSKNASNRNKINGPPDVHLKNLSEKKPSPDRRGTPAVLPRRGGEGKTDRQGRRRGESTISGVFPNSADVSLTNSKDLLGRRE